MCALVHLRGSAVLKAPNLDILHVGTENFEFSGSVSGTIGTLMQNPQLHLSPRYLLHLDTFLSPKDIFGLMMKYPRVSHVSLCLQSEAEALEVMDGILNDGSDGTSERPYSIGSVDKKEGDSTTAFLCPNLSALALTFHWPISELISLRNWAKALAESRMYIGVELAVYGSWVGEGTFMPLA